MKLEANSRPGPFQGIRSQMSSPSADEAAQAAEIKGDGLHEGADHGLFAPLRNALLDSRQRSARPGQHGGRFRVRRRTRKGRFTIVMPDPALRMVRGSLARTAMPTCCWLT